MRAPFDDLPEYEPRKRAMTMNAEPQVTVCPPGKRSLRRLAPTGERVQADPVKVLRSTAVIEARERADALSVALSQPHRAASDDPSDARLSTPLGRFCERAWPGKARRRHRNIMYAAGDGYDRMVRDELVARGLPYIGQAGGREDREIGDEYSPQEIEAMRDNVLALTRKLARANVEVRGVHHSAVRIMRAVCYEQQEPGPYDSGIFAHALYRLADHLGLVDHGINGAD